jgi:hypothetical protein
MRRVVDTNVAVVANGRKTNASIDCRLAAIEFLNVLLEKGRVILDLGGEIQEEYHRYLNPKAQPGVGDRFYRMILESAPKRVERIELTKNAAGEFDDFPTDPALAGFDISDRKFAAAARKSEAPVANATDRRSWHAYHAALVANGVRIEFVCGVDPSRWLESE